MSEPRVLYLVVCAAPPARQVHELVDLLHSRDWRPHVIATPAAYAGWLDTGRLTRQTGFPVRSQSRRPGDPRMLPHADAIVVAPATFNTINKWAAGISDTFALGILNESIGLGLPTVVSPYVKPSLAAHPAFARSLGLLREYGVRVTETEALRPAAGAGSYEGAESYEWSVIIEALPVAA